MSWLPTNPGCDESYELVYVRGSFVHQECSNYALTNLLFGLCKSMWIIDLLVIHPNPHPKAPTRLFTPELLWAKERTLTFFPSVVFTFGFKVESIKEFGVSCIISSNFVLNTIYIISHLHVIKIHEHKNNWCWVNLSKIYRIYQKDIKILI